MWEADRGQITALQPQAETGKTGTELSCAQISKGPPENQLPVMKKGSYGDSPGPNTGILSIKQGQQIKAGCLHRNTNSLSLRDLVQ